MYMDELIAASPRLERVCTSADEFGDVHMVRQDPMNSQQSSYIRMLILVEALLSFSPRSLETIENRWQQPTFLTGGLVNLLPAHANTCSILRCYLHGVYTLTFAS